MRALHAGMGDLPASRRELPGYRSRRVDKVAKHMFEGAEYRGSAHMLHMRTMREVHKRQRMHELAVSDARTLKKAWDDEQLRCGDCVGPGETAHASHPDTWLPSAVVKLAFRSLRGKLDREGTRGQHNHLDVVAAVAGAMELHQGEWLRGQVEHIKRIKACGFLIKHYDCTPMRLAFGRLQAELAPLARYSIKDDAAPNGWKTVSFEEFRAKRPNCKQVRHGVLEVLAQGHFLHWPEDDQHCSWSSARTIVQPKVLSSGSASALYSGVEESVPALAASELRRICEASDFFWQAEVPDGAASCRRKKAQSLEDTDDIENLFDISPPSCMAHSMHNVVASKEKTLIGDLHALHCTGSHVQFQNRMQASMRSVVDRGTWRLGMPDPDVRKRNANILKRTLLSLEYRTGATSVSDMLQLDLDDLLQNHELCQRILDKFNIPWTSRIIGHVCPGTHCCPHGASGCRDEMFCILCECDVTLSNDSTKPSMDDWGSGLGCGVKVAFGILLHEILPQVIERALPTWDSMA